MRIVLHIGYPKTGNNFLRNNYFLKIEKPFFERQKTNLISKLNDVSEILLIFEVDLEKDTNKKELFYD